MRNGTELAASRFNDLAKLGVIDLGLQLKEDKMEYHKLRRIEPEPEAT